MKYGIYHGVNMPNYAGVVDGLIRLGREADTHYWVRRTCGPFVVCHKPREIEPGGRYEVLIVRVAPDERNARVMDHIEVPPNGKPHNMLELAEQLAEAYYEDLQ